MGSGHAVIGPMKTVPGTSGMVFAASAMNRSTAFRKFSGVKGRGLTAYDWCPIVKDADGDVGSASTGTSGGGGLIQRKTPGRSGSRWT